MLLLWIRYLVFAIQFSLKKSEVQALINFGSKVNTMTLGYALKLGLKIHLINVKAQKIDNSTLETFEIVLASFQIEDKLEKVRFFQKTFLLVDFSIEIVLKMLFLTFNNINIQFVRKRLT